VPNKAVIDSGPLIALFDRDDAWHASVLAFFKELEGQLYTTIAVLTEVSHLLDFHVDVQLSFLDWVAKGAIEIVDLNSEDLRVICTLSQKYSDLPMDFADASLVHISEKLGIKSVISIDCDFNVYRTLSNGYLTNLLVQ
jgi:predicted nucleic acid-binding protein